MLSVRGGPHVTITRDVLGLTQTSDLGLPDPPATDIWWPTLPNLVHLRTPPPRPSQEQHLVVATEACTIFKLVVRILLECFLVVEDNFERFLSIFKIINIRKQNKRFIVFGDSSILHILTSSFLEGHNETINGSIVYVEGGFTEDEHKEIWQSRMREVF